MYCKVCRQFPYLADVTSLLYTGTGSFGKQLYKPTLGARATILARGPSSSWGETQIQRKLMKLFKSIYFMSKEKFAEYKIKLSIFLAVSYEY